ncbi:MAG: biotin/lipoyl-binding protein, partial [Caulobacteraceae bacterium]
MSANLPRVGVNLPVVADRFTAILRKEVERFDVNDEREFLPAALEILETPPSPARRLMGIAIGVFMLFALCWALFGKVDILATATGRILPAGRIKLIQPVSEGTVKQILVSDGDHVRAGQTLIALDPAVAGATQQSVSSDYVSAELDVERLTALKDHLGGGG